MDDSLHAAEPTRVLILYTTDWKTNYEEEKLRVLAVARHLHEEGGIDASCDVHVEASLCGDCPFSMWLDEQLKRVNYLCLIWSPSTANYVSSSNAEWPMKLAEDPRVWRSGYGVMRLYQEVYNRSRGNTKSPDAFILQFEEDDVDSKQIGMILGKKPLFSISSDSDQRKKALDHVVEYLLGTRKPPPSARGFLQCDDLDNSEEELEFLRNLKEKFSPGAELRKAIKVWSRQSHVFLIMKNVYSTTELYSQVIGRSVSVSLL